jgi:hypothetical protein
MRGWREQLRVDPLPALLDSGNEALVYLARRDLLGGPVGPVEALWRLPEPQKVLRKQLSGGAWGYSGGKRADASVEDYDQIETFRMLGLLVAKYGLSRNHPAIQRAGEYLFSRQTAEGDFRGIYGCQFTPNYTGAIMELLVQAGWEADSRIERGFRWLLSVRQSDGGWAIPLCVAGARWDAATLGGRTILPDPGRPSSHMVTGMALRAFAAHPEYSRSAEARAAGCLLAARLFLRDTYPGRQTPDFWLKCSYPFWFTDLPSALDSLSLLGFSSAEPSIAKALAWFADRQQDDGGWDLSLLRNADEQLRLWLTLAICRVLKRLT